MLESKGQIQKILLIDYTRIMVSVINLFRKYMCVQYIYDYVYSVNKYIYDIQYNELRHTRKQYHALF